MRSMAIITAAMLTASVVWGQASTTPTPATPAPASGAQTQSGAPNTAPSGAQAAPAGGAHRVLQAKSQEELKAYQEAEAKPDPASAEAAANDFATKFPNSELRASLFIRAMNMYSQQNNAEKVVSVGEKAIAADPTNPIPLVQVGTALAETTRDTDLDRDQRLAQAAKDAHGAIDNIDTGLIVPPNADPARVAGAKQTILIMAYDTLGMVSMSQKDFASAETNLQKAIDLSKNNPEAVLYLRLSVAQDNLKQYPQALDSANKAVQYARAGTEAQNLAKEQQVRLQKLMAAESPSSSGAMSPTTTPPHNMPQPGQSPVPGAATPAPH